MEEVRYLVSCVIIQSFHISRVTVELLLGVAGSCWGGSHSGVYEFVKVGTALPARITLCFLRASHSTNLTTESVLIGARICPI